LGDSSGERGRTALPHGHPRKPACERGAGPPAAASATADIAPEPQPRPTTLCRKQATAAALTMPRSARHRARKLHDQVKDL